jgi:sugar-specific transcriptional regulator TrmB
MKNGIVKILEETRKLGLSSYEAKTYLALLERESLTVSEIAKISRVPRTRIYDVLESLMIEGLAVLKPGKVKRYSAGSPVVLQDKLDNKIESEYKEQKKEISKAVLILKKEFDSRRADETNNGNLVDYIEILKNPDQIYRRYIQLCINAKSEILGFARTPLVYDSPNLIKEQNKVLVEAVHRNVKLKIIHELPPDEAGRIQMYRDINKAFEPDYEELRLIESLPIKGGIFDGSTTLFILEHQVLGEFILTGLVIDHPIYSRGFKRMFEAYWSDAIDHYILDGRKYYLSKKEQ